MAKKPTVYMKNQFGDIIPVLAEDAKNKELEGYGIVSLDDYLAQRDEIKGGTREVKTPEPDAPVDEEVELTLVQKIDKCKTKAELGKLLEENGIELDVDVKKTSMKDQKDLALEIIAYEDDVDPEEDEENEE